MVNFASPLFRIALVREPSALPYECCRLDGGRPVDGGSDSEPSPGRHASSVPSVDASIPDPATPAPLDGAVTPIPDPATAAPFDDAVTPIPDPFDDADALEALEDQIATLAAHIHAATHRLLTLIAEFDRRRGWELGGHRSCAYWLSSRTGIDLGAAREKVRAARALEDLPQTSASMARGELSFSKVRALTRVATEVNEGELLEFARGCTTAQLERMVRGFRRGSRADEAALERERHRSRTLSVFPDDDGMYVVRGRLPAEVGALLMRAVEAASDALYREERDWPLHTDGSGPRAEGSRLEAGGPVTGTVFPRPDADTESLRKAARRRADALGLLVERAWAAGFGGRNGGEARAGGEAEDGGAEDGEAEAGGENEGGDPIPIPISGSRAGRYQVVLHVEAETLKAEGEPGRSELEDGTRVSAETSGRLSCDASLVRVRHAPDGSILDVGRRTRTIPPALRRALEVRDQGCRFPGCGLRFAEGHHVKHWADGGETSLGNTLLLCRHHHRLVHEGGWTVDWWGRGRPVFFDPRGGTHFDGRWRAPKQRQGGRSGTTPAPMAGKRPALRAWTRAGGDQTEYPVQNPSEDRVGDPVAALTEENRRRGVKPDGWTASARWKREADIPDAIYFRALEALEEGGS